MTSASHPPPRTDGKPSRPWFSAATGWRVAGCLAAVAWLAVFLRLDEFKAEGFGALLSLHRSGAFWRRLAGLAVVLVLLLRTEKRRDKPFEWSFASLLALPLLLRWPAVYEHFPAFQPMTVWVLPYLVLVTVLAYLCPRPVVAAGRNLLAHPRAGMALYLLLVVFYGTFTEKLYARKGLKTGDEIYYVLQARSLAEDGTLNMAGSIPGFNFSREHFEHYHISKISRKGEAHSAHPFGLSLLMVPGWWVAGERGALAAMVLVSALLGPLLRRVLLSQTGQPAISTLVALLFSVFLPVSVYACRPYPELVAGICYLFAYHAIRHGDGRRWGFLLAGIVLGFSAWALTRRFILPAACINLMAIVRFARERQMRHALAFLLPQAVMIALLLGLGMYRYSGRQHAVESGLLRPEARQQLSALTLGDRRPARVAARFTRLENFKPSRLAGVLLDKRYGVVWINAFLAVWIPAAFVFFARQASGLRGAGMVFGSMFLMLNAFSSIVWPEGACHPARYLLAVIPFLALPLADLWSRRPGLLRAGGARILLMCSAFSLAAQIEYPEFFNETFKIFRALNEGLFDLASFTPRFHAFLRYSGPQDPPHILAAAAGLLTCSFLSFSRWGERVNKTRFFGILLVLMFLATCAATVYSPAVLRAGQ